MTTYISISLASLFQVKQTDNYKHQKFDGCNYNCHSAHSLYVKSNVVENLFSRSERIVTSEEDRIKERAVVLETLQKKQLPC